MHGTRETSYITRWICTLLHAAILAVAAWILFGGGGAPVWRWLGVLFSFGVVLFGRLLVTQFYLLKRKFSWDELGGVLFAILLYQVGFVLLGGYAPEGICALDVFGAGS